MRRIGLSPLVVFCDSDTFIFFPATPWMNAEEVQLVRDALETLNMPGSNLMTIAVGMQTCNVVDNADAATGLASSRTASGLSFPAQPVSKATITGSKQLVRFGFLAKNTTASDTTQRFAWAGGSVEYDKA